MALKLGVIADDFTGGTDIASFLVRNGLRTVQLTGVPDTDTEMPDGTNSVVISLKTRSVSADAAVSASLDALRFLQRLDAERFFFKYCSTFDSTPAGNIGPVTDALLAELGQEFTVVCPALPINGRTTYQGYLFVAGLPLHESGMRNHPITPMTDSNLMRLMDSQSLGKSGNVPATVVAQGAEAVRAAIDALSQDGCRYAILDALTDADLAVLGEAVRHMIIVTGGSGLAAGLAQALTEGSKDVAPSWVPTQGATVVLSGSVSEMTNRQVTDYRKTAASWQVDVEALLAGASAYVEEVTTWVLDHLREADAPMVYATAAPQEVARLQAAHGSIRTSEAIEAFFAGLAQELAIQDVGRFIVAGGETAGAVTTALGVTGFEVGPQICPGVPWVRSIGCGMELALKSGNFGGVNFFKAAQSLGVRDC